MTMMDELYQQVILDHNRRPRHFYKPDKPTHKAEGFNPLCGDHYHVYLTLNRDGTIEEVAFEGAGCAISKASLSIMTEALQGKTPEEAKALFEQFHEVVMGHVDSESAVAKIGKLAVFSGISKFPTRVKCAVLGWHTLLGALDQSQDQITTE